MNNWQNKKIPFIEDGRVFYNYKSGFTETGGSAWESRKSKGHKDGLIELLSFYNKTGYDIDLLVSLDPDFEYYIDPRPRCGRIYFLVSIDQTVLENLPDQTRKLPNDLIVKEYTNVDFSKKINEIVKLLRKYNNILSKKSLKYLGKRISFSAEIKNIQKFLKSLEEVKLLSGVIYAPKEIYSIKLGYSQEEFYIVFYNNLPMWVGREYYTRVREIKQPFLKRLLFNIEPLYDLAVEENKKKKVDKWVEFLTIVLGPELQISDKNSKLQNGLNVANVLTGGSLEGVEVPCLAKDFLSNELDLLIENSKLTTGKDCGLVSIDTPVVYKNQDVFSRENGIIDTSSLRIDIRKQLERTKEFVGDINIKKIIDGDISLGTLEDVYDKIINYISFEELAKKISDCLPDVGELKDVCIEVYRPLTVTFPDGIKISGVFDIISEILFKITISVSQKAILELFENFFDRLIECENGNLEIYNFTNDSDTIFGANASLVNKFINVKINDNFEDIASIRNFGVDYDNVINDYINVLGAVLTPQEMCNLVRGNPTDKTKDILDCVSNSNPNYPNREQTEDIFVEIGDLINFPGMFARFPEPTDNDACLSEEQFQARKTLLEFKDSEIPPEVLNEVIESAKRKLKQDIDFINDIVSKEHYGNSIVYGNSTPQDFIKNSIPTARQNENLKSIILSNINSVFDPMTVSFNEDLVGNTSILKEIMDVDISKNKNLVYEDPQFISRDNEEIKIGNSTFYSPFEQTVRIDGFTLEIPEKTNYFLNYKLALSFSESKFLRKINANSIQNNQPVQTVNNPSVVASINDQRPTPINIPSNLTTFDPASEKNYFLNSVQYAFETLYTMSYSTNILNFGKNYISQNLKNSINVKTELFENNWYLDGSSVRAGILEDYLLNENVTRNNEEYETSLITGLISSYIRIRSVEFLIKNYNLISDFGGENFVKNFAASYIQIVAEEIQQFVGFSRLTDLKTYIEADILGTFNELRKIYSETILNSNVIDLFLSNVEVLDTENVANVFALKGNFYILSTEEDFRFNMILDKGSNECRVITLHKAPTIEVLLNSDKVKNFFKDSIPLEELLSVLTIFNLKSYKRFEYFSNSLLCIKLMIENLINSKEISYDSNASNDVYNSKKVNSSKSDEDPRINVIKDLSLPWVLDLIF